MDKPLSHSDDTDLARIERSLWPKWQVLASHVSKYSPVDPRHVVEQLLTLDYKMPAGTRSDLKELLTLTMVCAFVLICRLQMASSIKSGWHCTLV